MPDGELDFGAVHDTFRSRIRGYLAGMAGEAEAEDLTQEVFLRVSRGLKDFRGESQLSTWIYRIATNTALDILRSRSCRPRMMTSLYDEAAEEDTVEIEDRDALTGEVRPGVEQITVRNEMNACIRSYLGRLPEDYRVVITLSEMAGLKNSEMAAILGVSLDTVKIRLHRARAKLRTALEAGCSFYRDERNEFACEPCGPLRLVPGNWGKSVSFSDLLPST